MRYRNLNAKGICEQKCKIGDVKWNGHKMKSKMSYIGDETLLKKCLSIIEWLLWDTCENRTYIRHNICLPSNILSANYGFTLPLHEANQNYYFTYTQQRKIGTHPMPFLNYENYEFLGCSEQNTMNM